MSSSRHSLPAAIYVEVYENRILHGSEATGSKTSSQSWVKCRDALRLSVAKQIFERCPSFSVTINLHAAINKARKAEGRVSALSDIDIP
jgi:hypothetical protein